jgi:hypothetical protein
MTMPKQFKLKDTKAGDVMCKINDGGTTNQVIELGQKAFGDKNTFVTHAGIMYDNRYIIESQGPGVEAHDISVGHNKEVGYVVFRLEDKKYEGVVKGAAEMAKIMFEAHAAKKNLTYALMGAATACVKSLSGPSKEADFEKTVDNIVKNGKQKFFCSQLVAWVYQFSAMQNKMKPEDFINLKDTLVSPSRLAEILVTNSKWTEVGYFLPNER